MLDEVLYMEARLFRMYREKHNISSRECLRLFDLHHIWEFIETCYDGLCTSSDDAALADIKTILSISKDAA